jgi:hypothetical protein
MKQETRITVDGVKNYQLNWNNRKIQIPYTHVPYIQSVPRNSELTY